MTSPRPPRYIIIYQRRDPAHRGVHVGQPGLAAGREVSFMRQPPVYFRKYSIRDSPFNKNRGLGHGNDFTAHGQPGLGGGGAQVALVRVEPVGEVVPEQYLIEREVRRVTLAQVVRLGPVV